jgi:choline dehydrogenase
MIGRAGLKYARDFTPNAQGFGGGHAAVDTFDYVIVGAGSAGCVLANRLSADPSVTVCLVEAGGSDGYIWIHIPVGYFYTFDNPRTDWRFRTEPDPGLNGRSIKYPRGRVLGGTSSINGMVYVRGQSRDYDGWRQQGNAGWAWDDVLPYFKRSEDQARGADEAHGVGGELRIEDLRASWEVLDAFCAAAVECGIRRTVDFNRGDNEGVGYFQVTQRNGRRMSTARAFLKPVRKRNNLAILSSTHATRILFEEQRAVGLQYERNGGRGAVRARREVIVAAGAVGSPQLLMLSGVGPPVELASHGIPVILPRQGVGANLQDHLAIRTMYRVRNTRTLNEQANSLLGRIKMGLEYAAFRRGPLTIPPALVNAFVKSDRSKETPDLQFVLYPLTYDSTGDPPHRAPGFTAGVCLLHPESRGSVTLRSADPIAAPKIALNFLSTTNDRDVAVAGVKAIRRVCRADAMKKFEPVEFSPGPEFSTDDELLAGIGRIGATIFHPVGTCKMGVGHDAVVDPRLRVIGCDGLRVIDASIMPTIISGNTNAAAIMIAEKGADMIREDGGHGSKVTRSDAMMPGAAAPRAAG